MSSLQQANKALVLRAFETLFNKRDYTAAESLWSPNYIQHSAHIAPGRQGLFDLIKTLPPTLKYENALAVAEDDLVILHGRFSGRGHPVNWIVVDIVRVQNGQLVEHWDVIQDEATRAQSKSGNPMFGKAFPAEEKQNPNPVAIPTEMRAARVNAPGQALVVEKVRVPEVGADQVLIKVEACGVCHSDLMVKYNHYPGITYPRIPGHEVCGRIVKLGANVKRWTLGQVVGAGWHGGHCNACDACRKGLFVSCKEAQVTGFHRDGGYAEYAVIESGAVVPVPDGMSAEVAAPFMCAGVTVYNSLRNVAAAKPGDLVAVQGLGGLGQLGIQFANKMGFQVAAISTTDDKKALALQLGAHYFINAKKQDAAAELNKLGGARVVLCTAPNAAAMSGLVGGIALDGTLLVLGIDAQPLSVSTVALISKRIAVKGWPGGNPVDTEETLRFAAQHGIKSPLESVDLAGVDAALNATTGGNTKGRSVVKL